MTSKICAAALAAALVFGTSAAAMAQGSPPVSDPTAKTPATPKQKVDSGVENGNGKPATTTGAGTASGAGGTAPSGAGNAK